MIAEVIVRDQDGDDTPGSGDQVADYIAGMSRDLGSLARRNRLMTLAYLLGMAQLEAETVARRDEREPRVGQSSDEGVDAS